MPGFLDFLTGSESKMKPFNKQSIQSLIDLLQGGGLQGNSLFGTGSSFLQNLLSGNPEAFKNFEAPYLQQFNEQIVPGIAERFAGAGTGSGAGSSSALFNSLAQAGRSLSTDLAGLRSGLQMQALPQALNYAQQPILNQIAAAQALPGQYYERAGQPGILQGLGQGAAFGIGQTLGAGNNPFSQLMQLFGGGGNKFPLTAGYDQTFRMHGIPGGY